MHKDESYLVPLVLARSGASSLKEFQKWNGLPETGDVNIQTVYAMRPYLLGYVLRKVRPGDSYWKLAQEFGSSVAAISIANPQWNPQKLPLGTLLRIPLPFSVVPTEIPMNSKLCMLCLQGICGRYPFCRRQLLTMTAFRRPVEVVKIGFGTNRVLYTAAHHANEWLTATFLLAALENFAKAYAYGESLLGQDIRSLLQKTTVAFVPMVNPDGVDLVTGSVSEGAYTSARRIAEDYPLVPFPDGWKANLMGTDLNLNYPAGWEQARKIKFAQGYRSPAPRDFVGQKPLHQPETQALAAFTRQFDPSLVLAYHTQGKVIYWQFQDYFVPGARELGQDFAKISGYTLSETPYNAAFAGFKDWFIQEFRRPGFTIEVGKGVNPLPLQQFPEIYADNLGILLRGLVPR